MVIQDSNDGLIYTADKITFSVGTQATIDVGLQVSHSPTMVGEQATVTLQFNSPVPLEEGCVAVVTFPSDININVV